MKPGSPAPYPVLPASALASLVSEKYGLKNVSCELIMRGVGDTYSVNSGSGRYILRIYRSTHRSPPQIKEETDLLTTLQNAGVSVSYPIADLSGKVIQPLPASEGVRHAVLFSYAPGQAASLLAENQLRSLGHEMARFHHVSANVLPGNSRWRYDIETTLIKPLEILKPFFSADEEGYAWLQTAVERVEKGLAQIDTPAFSTGYCHFDFLPKNFHFEGDAITLFDFDFVGYGWLVNDVMTFWQHLCLDVNFGRMTQAAADEAYRIFIAAYRELRPLSAQELAAVPYLGLGFWLFYSSFHTTHDAFYTYVQPAHLKPRISLVRQLSERYLGKEIDAYGKLL